MREGRGTQFDADVLDQFLASLDEILEIGRTVSPGQVPEPGPGQALRQG